MLPSSDHVLAGALRLARFKKHMGSAEQVSKEAAHRERNPPPSAMPRWLQRQVSVSTHQQRGWTCHRISPAPDTEVARRTILYFHGGAHVQEITLVHWMFLAKLARQAQVDIIVPVHPLAPGATVASTVPVAAQIARDLLSEGTCPLILMGDSSGGGIALAVAQQIEEANASGGRPQSLVLLSPWLDLTMTEPIDPSTADHDQILAKEGLIEAARLYVGETSASSPVASPLLGRLTGLPPITVYSGAHDILHEDARRLVRLGLEAGADINYVEERGAQHVYLLFPTAAGRRSFRHLTGMLS